MPKRFWPTQKARKATSDYSNLSSPTFISARTETKKASSHRWRDKGRGGRRKDSRQTSHVQSERSNHSDGWDPFESPTSVAQHDVYFSNDQVPFESTEWGTTDTLPSQSSEPNSFHHFPNSHNTSSRTTRANNPKKESKQMTFRELLSIIFAAFWAHADLYTDVLGLDHDYPSERQLRLAFFRQGRIILATPIESADDMTTLSFGSRVSSTSGTHGLPSNLIQAGVTVSRRAKLKFQAISLAYELLSDSHLKATYDEWRIWNTRRPPPGLLEEDDILGINLDNLRRHAYRDDDESTPITQHSVGLSNTELAEIIVAGANAGAEPYSMSDAATAYSEFSRSSTNSILRTGQYSTFQERRQERLQRAQFGGMSERNITWNEEVEELVLLDIEEDGEDEGYSEHYETDEEPPYYDNLEQDQSNENRDSFSSRAFNYLNLSAEDPYAHNDGVFFTSDNDSLQGTYNKKRSRRGNENNSLAQHADTNSSSDSSVRRPLNFSNQNPDDSLVTILDGPFARSLTESHNASAIPKQQSPAWLGHNQNLTTENKAMNPIITQEETIVTNEGKNEHSFVRVRVQSSSRNSDMAVEKPLTVDDVFRPFDSIDLDNESFPIYPDSGFSVSSAPTVSSSGDCVGIDLADTLNVAIGFHSSLSNYITGAVTEMKDNMVKLGKKWEELDLLQMGEGKDENSFFIQASELDAMMGMLRAEIESPPSAPSCDSTDLNQSADVSSIVRQSCGVDARCV